LAVRRSDQRDGLLDIKSWEESKSGGGDGDGPVHLWRMNNCLFRGKYNHTKIRHIGTSIVLEFEEAPIEMGTGGLE
jgi:hypothetical protein